MMNKSVIVKQHRVKLKDTARSLWPFVFIVNVSHMKANFPKD